MNHQIREIKGLTARELGKPAYYFESVGSTNTWLKENGAKLPHGTLCWTGYQTSGRGRLGRVWHADAGRSLSMSLLFKPSYSAALLPLICGIAVSQALCMLTGRYYQIKWPNDIICRDLKICGILCENCLLPHGGYAVAGIGINLLQTGEEFKKRGLPNAGSVYMVSGRAPDMEHLVASIINKLEPLWQILNQDGFSALKSQYEKLCITVGREVSVLSPDGRLQRKGLAVGIAEDGSQLVDSGNGPIGVKAGEVSVRGPDGNLF